MKRFLSILAIVMLTFSCQETEEKIEETISPEAEAFLNEFLQVVENDFLDSYSYNYTIKKSQIDQAISDLTKGARKIEDIYAAIDKVFELIGDEKGYVVNSRGEIVAGDKNAFDCILGQKQTPSLPKNIAYLDIPTSRLTPEDLAIAIQDQIRSRELEGTDAWIIDLRSLTEGSFEGMLAGLGPLLGEGVLGAFFYNDNKKEQWEYVNGASFIGGVQKVTVPNALEVLSPLPKVAVLIDRSTCREGEQLFAAILKRPNTQSFGNTTAGRAFLEGQQSLAEGHKLHFVKALLMDRENSLTIFPNLHPDGFSSVTVNFDDVFEWLGVED
ncbi:S41 family peptidase [Cognataquiflexum rubidum]|uniref:S41 family peptidase n=1 Tax=Cognataquiflexum rubidum TaxID=2922273 RepID=UPI001F13F542|nr:S41 family peptidase [Cognataquiflexum rubidum]MCH6232650.1 S41 family peptidase [Cognataquiflexum rubidum]